jgi:hypothetical protein
LSPNRRPLTPAFPARRLSLSLSWACRRVTDFSDRALTDRIHAKRRHVCAPREDLGGALHVEVARCILLVDLRNKTETPGKGSMSFETTLADVTTRLRQGKYPNEQAISQGIVLRVLQEMGWDAWDPTVVWPEYQTGEGRADLALCIHLPSQPSSSKLNNLAKPRRPFTKRSNTPSTPAFRSSS